MIFLHSVCLSKAKKVTININFYYYSIKGTISNEKFKSKQNVFFNSIAREDSVSLNALMYK